MGTSRWEPLKNSEGASSKVEKEKKHYQGLPEDLTPTAGKVGASAAENKKIDKTERSRKKRKKSEVEKTDRRRK